MAVKYFCDRCEVEVKGKTELYPIKYAFVNFSNPMPTSEYDMIQKDICITCLKNFVGLFQFF